MEELLAAFKTQAKIVRTFVKRLNPGDTFDFRMTHHCGPGIRFDVAKVYLNNIGGGMQPSSYGIIVEAKGTPCECIRNEDNALFQGTSPGWYNFEGRKGITLVRNSTVISNPTELSESITKLYAVKIHERQFLDKKPKKPITVPVNLIGIPGQIGVVSLSPEKQVYASSVGKEKLYKEVNFFDNENSNEEYQSYENDEENEEEEY